MMIFELKKPTTVTLASVSNRSESHGEDKVAAVSLHLEVQASASVLDMLCPELAPVLGVNGIESISLKTICEGWTLRMQNGIDDDTAITLGGCRLDKFKVSPGNDGLVGLRMRVGSHDLTPLTLGEIGMRVQQDVVVTITAPRVAMQTNSDAQHKAMKKQRALETAGQARVDTPEAALTRAAAVTPIRPAP